MGYVIRNKKTKAYVRTYFGSQWKDTYPLEKAQVFKTMADAQQFIKSQTAEMYDVKTGEVADPKGADVWSDKYSYRAATHYEILEVKEKRTVRKA